MRLKRLLCHYLNTHSEKLGKCILKPQKFYTPYRFFQFYEDIKVALSTLLAPHIGAEEADLFQTVLFPESFFVSQEHFFYFVKGFHELPQKNIPYLSILCSLSWGFSAKQSTVR
jgi:hypothetical protein